MKENDLCKNCGKEISLKKPAGNDFCSSSCSEIFNNRMKILDEGKETNSVIDIRKIKGIEFYKIRGPIKSYKFDYLFDKVTCLFSSKNKFSPIRNPKKILFLRNDHIGDMVYATPAFKIAKEAFPNSKVVVLAEPHNKSVIEKDKNVDEIWEIDLFWRRLFKFELKALFDYLKILRKIKRENFDVGLDLRRSKLNMLFFLFIPRIKNRVSNYNINGGKVFLTHPLVYKKTNFNHEENVDMINDAFGLHFKYILPYIAITKEDEKEADAFLKKNNIDKFIVVMPGCTEKDKQWSIDKTDKFIKLFLKKYPSHKIVVSSGKGDKAIIERLCKNDTERCVPEIGILNFRGLG